MEAASNAPTGSNATTAGSTEGPRSQLRRLRFRFFGRGGWSDDELVPELDPDALSADVASPEAIPEEMKLDSETDPAGCSFPGRGNVFLAAFGDMRREKHSRGAGLNPRSPSTSVAPLKAIPEEVMLDIEVDRVDLVSPCTGVRLASGSFRRHALRKHSRGSVDE